MQTKRQLVKTLQQRYEYTLGLGILQKKLRNTDCPAGSVQQTQILLSNHRVVFSLWCTQVLLLLSYQLTMITVKACSASFGQKLAVAKMLTTENGENFQLVRVFKRFVTHSRVAHKVVTIKADTCCVRACNFSVLACNCLGNTVDLQNLVKIKGVP
jgi:hypothetical protein